MVKWGTRNGPILPPAPTTQAPSPRRFDPPAPVHEIVDDIPNPSTYKPLLPHQYRTKIYKYRPNPNLILGTPLDKKYTPGYDKYAYYLKQKKSLGKTYNGPQFFELQQYEKENLKKKETQEASYRTVEVNPQPPQNHQQNIQYVPQIGIVYSSGVRYYVPQIFYYNDGDDIDNSVYEANDLKYYYHQKGSNY